MPSNPSPGSGGAAAKVALRHQLLPRRNRRSLAEVELCARELAAVLLAAPEVRRAATVAAYVSIGNEPGTGLLLDGLEEAGKRVILPVLVPGLAVSPAGMRLGRGGGSYDRALARVPVDTFTCILLYDDEVGLDVPVAPHARPVTAAATPSGLRALGGGTFPG